MNRIIMKFKILLVLTVVPFIMVASEVASDDSLETNKWQSPSEEILEVLHAPKLPWVWTAPTGEYLFLANPLLFPPLAELAAPMHKLAGTRVNPVNNSYHGWHGGTSPRLVRIKDGATTPLNLPEEAEVLEVNWTADGQRFALIVGYTDRIELWIGSVKGKIKKIEDVTLNPLMGSTVSWLPDQERLLIFRIPKRGPAPKPPAIPIGPEILEGEGASARSTYEARNLLTTAHDDALFEYYNTSELVIVDPSKGKVNIVGKPALYSSAEFSPDGKYILVERLVGPWSHEVAWWRFASEIDVWNNKGEFVANIASLPLANEVPIHGVPLGPRSVSWRPTAPHMLYWIEALDGGNPVADVSHRDRLMLQDAPFTAEPKEVFKAEHRIQTWSLAWGAEDGMLMLTQRERIRRWRYVWLLDVDKGTSRPWFDLDEDNRYENPGYPLYRKLDNGRSVLRQKENAIYFRGSGATDKGDRPFLDLRSLETGESKRLFRSDSLHYENFIAFAAEEKQFVLRSESSVEVPNYYLATFGKEIEAAKG